VGVRWIAMESVLLVREISSCWGVLPLATDVA
jgi:hypothetical protein